MVRSGAIVWRTNKNPNTTSRGVGGQANPNSRISKIYVDLQCVWGNTKGTLVTRDSTGTRYRNHTFIPKNPKP
jgi:hypothetical protein